MAKRACIWETGRSWGRGKRGRRRAAVPSSRGVTTRRLHGGDRMAGVPPGDRMSHVGAAVELRSCLRAHRMCLEKCGSERFTLQRRLQCWRPPGTRQQRSLLGLSRHSASTARQKIRCAALCGRGSRAVRALWPPTRPASSVHNMRSPGQSSLPRHPGARSGRNHDMMVGRHVATFSSSSRRRTSFAPVSSSPNFSA